MCELPLRLSHVLCEIVWYALMFGRLFHACSPHPRPRPEIDPIAVIALPGLQGSCRSINVCLRTDLCLPQQHRQTHVPRLDAYRAPPSAGITSLAQATSRNPPSTVYRCWAQQSPRASKLQTEHHQQPAMESIARISTLLENGVSLSILLTDTNADRLLCQLES